ncbi:glucose-6-phosphate dehydrogenase assembly protein OpcA [Rothia sp. CCM 9417]|uniref:glucose-6-phosphate dehydrogenase assembly protein OpcA n=1 Tax=unclassified Rothia (in: high G+C Gram-positive bacteria) TaxID=2689056 RepID=UPI003AC46D14
MMRKLNDTTVGEIAKELARLRNEEGATTSSRVLTLVILAEKGHSKTAVEAALKASYEHPSRIIVHIDYGQDAPDQLNASIYVGGDAGASELIILRGYGSAAVATESLISGLLLPDSPIVAWWPHSVPENPAEHSIGRIAQRRITDSARAYDPLGVLEKLADSYKDGDTDLAWIRLTLWRIQIAAVLDQLGPAPVSKVTVSGSSLSPSVVLLGAWLGTRLGATVHLRTTDVQRGLYRVQLEREDGRVTIHRPGRNIATVSSPGTPDQQISLPVRSLADCLAEELRRLDPDEVYGEVLQSVVDGCNIVVDINAEDTATEGADYTEVYDA